jgi:hypothetical protein
MAQNIATQEIAIGRPASRSAPRFARVVRQFWHGLAKGILDPYRPEQHYMRGPGPKWHAKHAFGADQHA